MVHESTVPEIVPPPDDDAAATWPRAIGIISIIYAAIGMSCASCLSVFSAAQPAIVEMVPDEVAKASMDQTPLMRFSTLASGLVLLALGVMLMRGGIGCLRRTPAAIDRLKRWAVLRMIVMVLALGVAIVTAPQAAAIQVRANDLTNDRLRDAGMPPRALDEDSAWRRVMITSAVMAGVVSIYPLFLGFFLSGRRVREETARWL